MYSPQTNKNKKKKEEEEGRPRKEKNKKISCHSRGDNLIPFLDPFASAYRRFALLSRYDSKSQYMAAR